MGHLFYHLRIRLWTPLKVTTQWQGVIKIFSLINSWCFKI
ncbi:hypothetical protein AB28_2029 [Raoultella ornithinolytica 2-156-04_S1_C2]|nr:hypothetical protein AB00_1838 [Raoultella ornithinolytica 2-156-04_S1_C1]KDX13926.1 hypothetical protein AB28_2029 [Raoultella ornithinolytica 2-156-04_S1_C2]